jgi:vesicle-fusing ATPase
MITGKCTGLPSGDLAYENKIFIAARDYSAVAAHYGSEPVFVEMRDFVFMLAPHPKIDTGIGLSKPQRDMAKISIVDDIELSLFYPPSDFFLGSLSFEVEVLGKVAKRLETSEEELDGFLKGKFMDFIFNAGQVIVIHFKGVPVQLKVTRSTLIDFNTPAPTDEMRACKAGFMNAQTLLEFVALGTNLTIQSNKVRTLNMFSGPKFNFEELGIGGLDREFGQIFRRVFASRLFPPSVMERLGIKHVKGMLLFGPPGTGKTLIAKQLAKCLNAREPKLVNGPEVFNKFVGQTEENVRNLFKDAEIEQAQQGDQSKLHIIIFDEFDAIAKPRGTVNSGTGVHDTVVNQLLSKIDGVESLNNILIIGMTNRKDMIDEAVLRPGRLEVHVEVGLPDDFGRQQILKIHTKMMKKTGVLLPDVDLPYLAAHTKNFSGAELETLVKNAASFALNREIDLDDLQKVVNVENIKVGMKDFHAALLDIKPMFGVDTVGLEVHLRGGIINYGPRFDHMLGTCQTLINQVRNSSKTPLLSILLEGPSGSGKTALAAKLAMESGFPYIKVINPEQFVSYTENGKVSAIAKIFEDAYRSPLSFIVLDNIERLIDYVSIGPRFSNTVLQAILVLVKKQPQQDGRRVIIFGTTSNASFLEDLDLVRAFNVVLEVPKLSDPNEIVSVIRTFPTERSSLEAFQSQVGEVPIKQLLMAIEMALQDSETLQPQRFFECLRSISF